MLRATGRAGLSLSIPKKPRGESSGELVKHEDVDEITDSIKSTGCGIGEAVLKAGTGSPEEDFNRIFFEFLGGLTGLLNRNWHMSRINLRLS